MVFDFFFYHHVPPSRVAVLNWITVPKSLVGEFRYDWLFPRSSVSYHSFFIEQMHSFTDFGLLPLSR
jgi:hypothetical protein